MKKRILACLLALVMLIGAMPVMALAAEPEAENWEVSKSKTATALDADGSTRVTLSLPSAEENLATDVLLVLDASKCAKDMLLATIDLIDDLNEQVEAGANIKVGIVMFKGNAVPFQQLSEGSDLNALKSTLESLIVEHDNADGDMTKANVRSYVAKTFPKFMNGGTNIPAGLQLAKNMLAEDTAVTDARKYVVLVSDGDTYLFCHKKSDGSYDYINAYTRSGPMVNDRGGISESYWNGHKGETKTKYDSAMDAHTLDSWKDYLTYVRDNNSNFEQYDFLVDISCLQDPKRYPDYFDKATQLIPEDSEKPNRIINSDVSRYQTAQLYRELQSKYHTYYCYLPGGYDMARTMLQDLTPADHRIDAKGSGSNVFASITKDIVFAVGVGSTVTDIMGYDTNYNFDLVPDSLILTVGGQSLASLRDGNTYYFGDTGVNGVNKDNCRFKVVYTPENDGKEKFVWTINEAVSNFSRVQLSYQLRLRDDARTSTDGYFYTNVSATLKPMDSKGAEGKAQEFERPKVKFGSDADYLLPILNLKKAAPKLNTRDHFAYVQGYPDGTVKPAGSITRAEVAAILFRLMDADSRSLYYSTASGFRDVDSAKWYNTYVATLNNAGVITDSRTGYFRPNDAITRAELAAMLAQFAEKKSAAIYFSDVSAGYWAANAIALTANLGWINGYPDGTFGPDKTVTRAELMAMVNRATGRAPKSTSALLSGMKTWKDNADTARWYYLDVQEATNSHTYLGAPTETWASLTATPDWSQYE